MKPFEKETLALIQEQPHNRSAYSDRTAYILAGMSMLAYERFEPEIDIKSTLAGILSMVNSKKIDIDVSNLEAATPQALKKIVNSLDKEVLASALKTKSNNKKELVHNLNEIGWELKDTISVTNNICDTQAIIAQKENQVVLAFRGTEKTKIKDIMTDLKFIKKHTKRGEVHSGFHTAYQEAKHQIITKLHNTIGKNNSIKLFVTGHSLGGALAAIATRDIELNTPLRAHLAACYTYGCPRYGTYEFISHLKTPIYRVVNNNDIVTKIPLSGDFIALLMLLFKFLEIFPPLSFLEKVRFWIKKHISGYTHYGSVYLLSKTHQEDHADIRVTHHKNIWKRILLSAEILKGRIRPKSFISDHSINNYCEKLKAHAIIKNRKLS